MQRGDARAGDSLRKGQDSLATAIQDLRFRRDVRVVIIGGAGRDILIGGMGGDRLVGGGGDDVLIGGSTIGDDDDEALWEALAASISAGWSARPR